MGAGFHGGFRTGTKGAKGTQTQSLIRELEKSGVKFKKRSSEHGKKIHENGESLSKYCKKNQ